MAKKNTFSRIGGSVYKCECCGRGTRHTGEQALGSKLCPQCWELAGLYNEIQDGYKTVEEAQPEAKRLCDIIVSKGGKPDWEYAIAEEVKPKTTLPKVARFCKCGVAIYSGTALMCPDCESREAVAKPLPTLKPEKLDLVRQYAVLEVSTRTFRVIVSNPATHGSIPVFTRLDTYSTFGAAFAKANELQSKEDAKKK